MRRSLSIVTLLILPTFAAQAQRGQDDQSDSTESNAVRGVAAIGTIGLSLLKFALHNNDGPAQRFCYADCGNVRRAAALELTAGPTPLRLNERDEKPGVRNHGAAADGEIPGLMRDEQTRVRSANAFDAPHSDDVFDYFELPPKAKGLGPILPPDIDAGGNGGWNAGHNPACMLQTCTSDRPLLPNTNPPGPSDLNNGPGVEYGGGTPVNLLAQQADPIVNPEPGTWIMLAAGFAGLMAVRRKSRV